MDDEDPYAMIRKVVYNQRFLSWMEKEFLARDSEQLENETTDLFKELEQLLEKKPLMPALVALCEVTCQTYKGIVGETGQN